MGESSHCDVLREWVDHVSKNLKVTVVEVGIRVQDGILRVDGIVLVLLVDIEEDSVTLGNTKHWVEELLVRGSILEITTAVNTTAGVVALSPWIIKEFSAEEQLLNDV